MSEWKKQAIQLSNAAEAEPVPIVSDGVVAVRGMAEGRMIPLLIIDTSRRPDIEDMIRAHKHLGSGDVMSGWSIPSYFDESRIWLILTITKPSRCVVILEFDVAGQGGVVDQIIQMQGVYIQPGREGDRLASTWEHERLTVEVPSRDFRKEWDRIFRKALKKKFRMEGLGRIRAKQAVEDFLKEWRGLLSNRLRSS